MKPLTNTLIELELYCLKPEVRASREALDRVLADDFMEITGTGVLYDKEHALSRIPGEVSPKFTQQDHEMKLLGDGIAQLLYRASVQKTGESRVSYSLRSSIWKLNGKDWQMLFHQGTPCEAFEVVE
mgnify:CR=1 FL=1